MNRFKTLLRGILSTVIVISSVIGIHGVALASAETQSTEGLVSVEIIPNYIVDAYLPENLREAVAPRNMISNDYSTRGTTVPSADSTWNLTSDGAYSFHVNSSTQTIYSNYVFTGHYGSVKVYLDEISSTSGQYTFRLYKRGVFNTVLYKYKFDHGAEQTIEMSSFNSTDKIFFAITPDGLTQMSTSSYIMRY